MENPFRDEMILSRSGGQVKFKDGTWIHEADLLVLRAGWTMGVMDAEKMYRFLMYRVLPLAAEQTCTNTEIKVWL